MNILIIYWANNMTKLTTIKTYLVSRHKTFIRATWHMKCWNTHTEREKNGRERESERATIQSHKGRRCSRRHRRTSLKFSKLKIEFMLLLHLMNCMRTAFVLVVYICFVDRVCCCWFLLISNVLHCNCLVPCIKTHTHTHSTIKLFDQSDLFRFLFGAI